MYKNKFENPTAILAAADAAAIRAGEEPNQSSYNAAYLHGYAAALREVSKSFQRQKVLRFITEADYRAMIDSIDHCENGIREYSHCLDDTWRASRFCDLLREQLQNGISPLPAEMRTVPNIVTSFFHGKYKELVEDLAQKEADHEADPACEQKDFDYIEASAKVMLLCDFCNCVEIELLDEDMQPIPPDPAYGTPDIKDFPMWLVDRIRKEYEVLWTALRHSETKEQCIFISAQVDCLEDFCKEADIDLQGNDGELISPLTEE